MFEQKSCEINLQNDQIVVVRTFGTTKKIFITAKFRPATAPACRI